MMAAEAIAAPIGPSNRRLNTVATVVLLSTAASSVCDMIRQYPRLAAK